MCAYMYVYIYIYIYIYKIKSNRMSCAPRRIYWTGYRNSGSWWASGNCPWVRRRILPQLPQCSWEQHLRPAWQNVMTFLEELHLRHLEILVSSWIKVKWFALGSLAALGLDGLRGGDLDLERRPSATGKTGGAGSWLAISWAQNWIMNYWIM